MNLQLASDYPPFPMRRSYHRVNLESLDYQDLEGRFEEVPEAEANTVSSMVAGTQWHAPVLDIDFPCTLLPSSTPGHHHLYIDKLVTWEQYEGLLIALADCGIIERGYLHASLHRRQLMSENRVS